MRSGSEPRKKVGCATLATVFLFSLTGTAAGDHVEDETYGLEENYGDAIESLQTGPGGARAVALQPPVYWECDMLATACAASATKAAILCADVSITANTNYHGELAGFMSLSGTAATTFSFVACLSAAIGVGAVLNSQTGGSASIALMGGLVQVRPEGVRAFPPKPDSSSLILFKVLSPGHSAVGLGPVGHSFSKLGTHCIGFMADAEFSGPSGLGVPTTPAREGFSLVGFAEANTYSETTECNGSTSLICMLDAMNLCGTPPPSMTAGSEPVDVAALSTGFRAYIFGGLEEQFRQSVNSTISSLDAGPLTAALRTALVGAAESIRAPSEGTLLVRVISES